jgi:hypothetical protein
MNTVARPATSSPGASPRRRCVDRRVVLDRPLDVEVRAALLDQLGRLADPVDGAARFPDSPGRVRQHRDARLDAEGLGGGRRADGDVGEPLGVGFGVDGAVAVDEHPVGQGHQEHRRHDRDPGAVRMISNAGRIVCWVVCAAPDTIPSASPRWTIMVPK